MTPTRPLAGVRVGLSIAESEDATSLGFPSWQVNRATVRVVAALFGQGVGVVFGHDWREDGVMEAVHGLAQQMQPPPPPGDSPDRAGAPLLINLVPWPDRPHLSSEDLELLQDTLSVRPAPLPKELNAYAEPALAAGRDSRAYAYLRSRGLTYLRRELDRLSDARLCLGGRVRGYSGRAPGIVEEAFIAVESGKALYLAGLFGGAAGQLIDAIEGKPMPPDFARAPEFEGLYLHPPFPADVFNGDAYFVNAEALWTSFRNAAQQIAERSMLTRGELNELFHTTLLDRVIELVLTGLSRRRREGQ